MSLKKLSGDTSATSVRFFGKFLGTERDYYVAEAQVEGEEEGGDGEEEKDADFEPKGTGVNRCTYFVAHDSLSAWVRLPDVAPREIAASRSIKVLLSGDLERNIYTNPFFFGKEKHYLRAQIARIVHSTTLVPVGLMRIKEDEEREIEENAPEDDAELVMPSTHQMANPEMWAHAELNILKNCRTAHMEPEEPEGAEDWDAEVEKKKIEAADPYDVRLKKITADSKVKLSATNKQSAWVVRLAGDATEYAHEQNPAKTVCNGVVVVRSLTWPGAFSFYHCGEWKQIYVGNGHKYEQASSYFPVHPPMVLEDPEEFPLGPEPTPLTEPEPDAEKPEGEEGEEDE